MLARLIRPLWKPGLAVVAAFVVLTSVAAAYGYTVVFGTPGNDVINESGKAGNYHIYAFQGSDTVTGGLGNITGGHVNGYDWLYGDGRCSATPPGDDSYCERPGPFSPQPWSDAATASDTINGGNGPDWIIGGGGNNVLNGSGTYDVIVGGPHNNVINGGKLGSTVVVTSKGSKSTITLKPSKGASNLGLTGVSNWVDVYNQTSGDTVTCAGYNNGDIVYADTGDTVRNCQTTVYLYSNPPGAFNSYVQGQAKYPPGMGTNGGSPKLRRHGGGASAPTVIQREISASAAASARRVAAHLRVRRPVIVVRVVSHSRR